MNLIHVVTCSSPKDEIKYHDVNRYITNTNKSRQFAITYLFSTEQFHLWLDDPLSISYILVLGMGGFPQFNNFLYWCVFRLGDILLQTVIL